MHTPELIHDERTHGHGEATRRGRVRVKDMARGALEGTCGGRGDMSDADVIIGFDFGQRPNPEVSTSNRQLGELLSRWPDVPVLAQPEIATVLARAGRLVINIDAEARRRFRLPVDAYVDTACVVSAAHELVTDAGWHRVGVIAHPSHALRCIALLEARGLTTLAPALTASDVTFDPVSKQWWTRGRRVWATRELAVLAHHSIRRTFRSR